MSTEAETTLPESVEVQHFPTGEGYFEELHGSEVAKRVRGCKADSTLWLSIKQGTFPPPDKTVNGVRYWKTSTLRNWQEEAS